MNCIHRSTQLQSVELKMECKLSAEMSTSRKFESRVSGAMILIQMRILPAPHNPQNNGQQYEQPHSESKLTGEKSIA
jgi:hypothetical protein